MNRTLVLVTECQAYYLTKVTPDAVAASAQMVGEFPASVEQVDYVRIHPLGNLQQFGKPRMIGKGDRVVHTLVVFVPRL